MDKIANELGKWHAIRLSSFKELDIQVTLKMLEPYRYIVSEEGDGVTTKYHQHIILVSELETEEIRQLIKKFYPGCKGNSCLYIKASKDKTQLAKYTLKEGNYKYKGFSEKYIQDTFKTSSPKTDLKKDVRDLEDKYILDIIDIVKFTEQYLLLKAKHDQPIYMNHVEAYLRKMKLKKEPGYVRHYAAALLDRI